MLRITVTVMPSSPAPAERLNPHLITFAQAILNKLHEEKGECSLEYLRSMTDDDIKAELSR